MSVLLIDFESTGIDPKTARILEIGARVATNDFKMFGQHLSILVHDDDYPDLSEEVQRVTHITPDMLEEAYVPRAAFQALGELVDQDIEFVIAYNTAYDAVLFKEEMFRHNLSMNPQMSWLLTVPWLCAMSDIETNYAFKSWKQMHIALEYGVTVNPRLLHRALADVDLMHEILLASGTNPQAMFDFQCDPWIYVVAKVDKPWLDDGRSTTLAKASGYQWERAKGDYSDRVFSKQWVKRVKSKNYEQELTLPFKVERITQ